MSTMIKTISNGQTRWHSRFNAVKILWAVSAHLNTDACTNDQGWFDAQQVVNACIQMIDLRRIA
jgi:hypothetical protein